MAAHRQSFANYPSTSDLTADDSYNHYPSSSHLPPLSLSPSEIKFRPSLEEHDPKFAGYPPPRPQHAQFNDPPRRSTHLSTLGFDKRNASDASFDMPEPTDDGTERHFDLGHGQSDWRPAPVEKPSSKRSAFLETIFPSSMACRLYLISVLVETFIDIAIEGTLLWRVNDAIDIEKSLGMDVGTHKNRIPVYLAIFAMAHVFQFLLALDAVYNRNTLQFAFLAVFNALFLVYSAIQIFEIRQLLGDGAIGLGFVPISALTIAIPVVIAIAEIAYVALGWRIYGEFGWSVYKQMGADRRIKAMYAHYQIFECLVRFDIFFWLGFSVQLITLVLQKNDFEFYLTIAALPLSMLLLFEGHLAARNENRWMMGTFLVGCVAALAYFSYKLFRIWSRRTTEAFVDVYKSLSVFSCISIVLLVITFAWSLLVLRNFDNGLKYHLSKNKKERPHDNNGDHELETGKTYPTGNPSRMSIE